MTRIYIYTDKGWARKPDVTSAPVRRKVVAEHRKRGVKTAWFDYANDTFGVG